MSCFMTYVLYTLLGASLSLESCQVCDAALEGRPAPHEFNQHPQVTGA